MPHKSIILGGMNENPSKRFIYVTPLLDEAKRIKSECPSLNFCEPEDTFSKAASFEELVRDARNIAMSHTLFTKSKFSKATLARIREFGYDLILDEELECIEANNLTKSDSQLLLIKTIEIKDEDGGRVVWRDSNYSGKHMQTQRAAESGALYSLGQDKYIWLLPMELLDCFDNVTVITYLYKYSLLYVYLKLKGFSHEFCYVQDGILKYGRPDNTSILTDIRNKITIYDGPLNKIGEPRGALSATWFLKNSKRGGKLKALLDNAYNYLHNIVKGSVEDSMWSVVKGKDGKLKTEGRPEKRKRVVPCYKTCELPYNARATNEYKHKTNLAYLCNSYPHPFQVEYFSKFDIHIDADGIALSRLVQWVWRSAIREGNPINLYIPSSRIVYPIIHSKNHTSRRLWRLSTRVSTSGVKLLNASEIAGK